MYRYSLWNFFKEIRSINVHPIFLNAYKWKKKAKHCILYYLLLTHAHLHVCIFVFILTFDVRCDAFYMFYKNGCMSCICKKSKMFLLCKTNFNIWFSLFFLYVSIYLCCACLCLMQLYTYMSWHAQKSTNRRT